MIDETLELILKRLWCNGYRRKKWTQWPKFKSWTRLFVFHKALIHLGKVWFQLFSLLLWVNSRADLTLYPFYGNWSKKKNSEFKPIKVRLKIDLVSHPARTEGLDKFLKVISSISFKTLPPTTVIFLSIIPYKAVKQSHFYLFVSIENKARLN